LNKLEKLVVLKINLINNSLDDDADKAIKQFLMENYKLTQFSVELKKYFIEKIKVF